MAEIRKHLSVRDSWEGGCGVTAEGWFEANRN
jgi:hypothetical protein